MIGLLGAAWAGTTGGGLYLDGNGGGGWTDRVGPVTRGSAGALSFGGYAGKYRGTYRFGDWWRVGVGLRWNPVYARDLVKDGNDYRRQRRFVESQWFPSVELGHGADLMNLGGYWVLGAGPVVLSDQRTPFDAGAARAIGGGVSGSAVAGYNVNRALMFTLRVTGAVQVVQGVSFSGGVGIGAQLRAPVLRLRDDDEEPDGEGP